MKKILYLFVFFLSFSTVSCGYSTTSMLPPRLKTVHVEVFENKIDFSTAKDRQLYIPLIEVKLQKAISDRFLFDGNLRLADKNNADLILRGQLLNYRKDELRLNDNDDVQEFRASVLVSLEMFDTEKQEVLWTEAGFVGDATFFTEGATATTEESAVESAVLDTARRIVERTIEDW